MPCKYFNFYNLIHYSNKVQEIKDVISKFTIIKFRLSYTGSISLKPPCSVTEETLSQELTKCCRVLNGMFHKSNTESIMPLMKYSLDISNPWVPQYYATEKEGYEKQTFGDNRDIYKLWLNMSGNKMRELFSKNGRHNFLEENG